MAELIKFYLRMSHHSISYNVCLESYSYESGTTGKDKK